MSLIQVKADRRFTNCCVAQAQGDGVMTKPIQAIQSGMAGVRRSRETGGRLVSLADDPEEGETLLCPMMPRWTQSARYSGLGRGAQSRKRSTFAAAGAAQAARAPYLLGRNRPPLRKLAAELDHRAGIAGTRASLANGHSAETWAVRATPRGRSPRRGDRARYR